MTDHRRYGVIEVRRHNAETYHLMIDGQMWSEVEWSHDRQAWCIQDAAGHCLAHVEHIVGQDRDVESGYPACQAHDRRRLNADTGRGARDAAAGTFKGAIFYRPRHSPN